MWCLFGNMIQSIARACRTGACNYVNVLAVSAQPLRRGEIFADATDHHLSALASLAIVPMRAKTQADAWENIAYRPVAQTCPRQTVPTCAALPPGRVRQAWPVRRMFISGRMPFR